MQPGASVAEANAFVHQGAIADAGPIVLEAHAEPIAFTTRGHDDRRAAIVAPTVLDRVLEEGLQEKHGNARVENDRVHAEPDGQLITKAAALDLEVVVQ